VKICTIHFDEDRPYFEKLLKVWEHSARLHNPKADIHILKVPKPKTVKRKSDEFLLYSSSYAAIRMAEWALKQNEPVIMTDADVMFLGDCSSAFGSPFDLGVTIRFARAWVNAGVVFYQPTQSGKEKLKEFISLTNEILAFPELYVEEIHKYLGGDQTAFTLLAKKYSSIKRFLCSEWNLEQNTWQYFSDKTKIVHVKCDLLDLINGAPPRSGVGEDSPVYALYEIWKSYYKEAYPDD